MDAFSQLRRSYDTDMLILRTLFALDPNTNLPISTNFIVTTDGVGGLVWMDPFENLSTAGAGIGYLPSTIYDLQTNLSTLSSTVSTINYSYQAGLSTLSTVLGLSYISTGIYVDQLTSSLTGLGSAGYISSSQLVSTVNNLGSVGYISTSSLVSTVNWLLDPLRYISSGNLISTTAGFLPNTTLISSITGLGSAGYVSSTQLVSTVQGLSTLSFSTIQSTVQGLGSAGYVSTSQLLSSFTGLASLGYVSSTQLVSTTQWILSTNQYVSTGALVSTTAGLSTLMNSAVFIDNAGNITINGGTIIFSSVANVVYLSSFVFSSITYEGTNGLITAATYNGTPPRSMIFSTANLRLDNFSSYITTRSRLYIDFYPTFIFSGIYQGASGYLATPISTFLQYGTGNYLTAHQSASWVYGTNTSNAFGNLYQQPIKLQIPGSVIANNYANPYILCHNMVSSLTFDTTNGFKTSNIDIRVGSTNSVFLTIQNLP
jgi:hypothetical protein